MRRRAFLIPSLVVAGFGAPSLGQEAPVEAVATSERDNKKSEAAVSLFRADKPIQLTGHSSHRSHSSHSSHRSSSGGGYYSPAPFYSPPPPPPPPPPARPYRFLETPRALIAEEGFTSIVKKVQSGLKAFGYYAGEVDGQVGPETKAALLRLQTDYSLKQTGTITPEVFKALEIEP